MEAKTITEAEAGVRVFNAVWSPTLKNPYNLLNEDGRIIGYCTLSFIQNGLNVEMFLAPDSPERLDLEVNSEIMTLDPDVWTNPDGTLSGSIYLRRV